jgi:hypothetical protein
VDWPLARLTLGIFSLALVAWLAGYPLPLVAAVSGIMMVLSNLVSNVGSMANLIVAERAAARGQHLGFFEFARAGVPIAFLSVVWGLLWLA